MKSDHWFYGIFRDCPWLFFRLMDLPEGQAVDYRFDAVELKETSFRLDGIFLPQRPGDAFFFLETQLYRDDGFYRNWLAKLLLYVQQHRVETDWRGLVLFGSRGQEPSQTPGLQEWLASGRIRRVFLDELPDYPDGSLDLAVLKLAVTKREALPAKAHELALAAKAAGAKSPTDPKKLLEFIEAFVVSNFPRLTRQEIQAMLQLNDIRESTIFQEGKQEGKLEGLQEGIREGEQVGIRKGLQEGKLEGQMAIIARLHAKGRSIAEICDLLDVEESLVHKALERRPRDG